MLQEYGKICIIISSFSKEIFEKGGYMYDILWFDSIFDRVAFKRKINKIRWEWKEKLEIVNRSVLLLHFYFYKKIELNVATHLVPVTVLTSHNNLS